MIVSGIPLAHYEVGDQAAESYAMVKPVELGWASQKEVARAFGCSTRRVRRYQNRMDKGGLPALGRPRGYPSKRPRASHARERLVGRLKAQGAANKEIARRLGVTPKAIRKLLKRIGWRDPEPEQCCLLIAEPGGEPKVSAFAPAVSDNTLEILFLPAEPVSLSFDSDPADRRLDRLLASLGMLDDAAPLFPSAAHVPHGGVMLALPALVGSGIFTITRKICGSIGPAFYGLRTTFIILLLMALLRIKRPESLKEHSPEDLGKVLGLGRAPEVKTLPRKLSRLAAFGHAADLACALARKRVEDRGAAMGFLYVDGHASISHGKRTLPKAHVASRRLTMPATTDYWVNDMVGDPVFVVTAEANAGMVKMLPAVLEQVGTMVGERQITVVFDRGGFSPKLFLQLVAGGFDILTYRKGASPRVAYSRIWRRCIHVCRARGTTLASKRSCPEAAREKDARGFRPHHGSRTKTEQNARPCSRGHRNRKGRRQTRSGAQTANKPRKNDRVSS